MDLTERSRDMLCYPVCYTGVIVGFRAMPGCLMGYMDVTEGSRAMLQGLVRYMDLTQGSRVMLVYLSCYTSGLQQGPRPLRDVHVPAR
jgi:hypothetical protein